MTRFLIASDLQMGAHPDYGRSPGDRLADMEAVWEAILGVAVDQNASAVLLGGDVFQYRRPQPAELMAFQRPLLRFLAEHDVPVLAINGNHDVESSSLPSALELFEPVMDVHTEPGVWTPSGNLFTPGEVAVCTLPWVPMSRLRERMNGAQVDDVSAAAAQLLIDIAAELRARVEGPAILLAHWHVDTALAMSGKTAGELFREPLLCEADLERLGFDAVAVGHNHRSQMIGSGIFHVGSPQPIDFGEAESAHGVWILDFDVDPDQMLTFVPIESRPFVTYDLPVESVLAGYGANAAGISFEDAVVRVRYSATEEQARRIDHAAITRALLEAGAHKVFAIQPTILRENRARIEGATEDLAPLAALGLWMDANEITEREPLTELTARYLEVVA